MQTQPLNFRHVEGTLPWHGVCAAAVLVFGTVRLAAQDVGEKPAAEVNALKKEAAPAHIRQLAAFGLEPTRESLGGFLRELHPSEQRKQQTDLLIEQLGHPEYQQREAAMTQLVRRPFGATTQLQAAQRSENAEVRWRAKRVLQSSERDSRALLNAVLTTITHNKLTGLGEPVLKAASFCDEAYLRNALHRALQATTTKDDAKWLREALSADKPAQRIAALIGLVHLLKESADDDAIELLDDCDDSVRVTAAELLAGHGRREALPVLVELLEARGLDDRITAFRTLRALTGESFGYLPYDSTDKRIDASRQWQKWLDENAPSVELRLPLQTIPVDLGRLLVCDHSLNKLIEFDAQGEEVWQRQVPIQPWACLGLPNGNRLVGSYNERCIIEYDGNGTEVWKVDNLPGGPTSVQRLESGNTLIACTEASIVVEVNPEKSTVWKVALDGRPVDARRLDDGNTLVALQNAQKVIEVDPTGKKVSELNGVGAVFSAQRLPDGNTLVCSLNLPQIREYDPSGNVVWSKGGFTNPYTAQRLADGNTMVVDRSGVTEVDLSGGTVRHLPIPNVSRAWRY